MRALFSILAFIGLFFASCNPREPSATTQFSGVAMTVPYTITIGDKLSNQQKIAVNTILQDVFHRIDKVYNKWNPDSEIGNLNALKAGEKYPISDELHAFFTTINEIYELTNGYFDPTIESMQHLWKRHLEAGLVPGQDEIEIFRSAIGWKSISYQNKEFKKSHDLTTLDLGGIAKGYCVDLISQALSESGFPNHLVDWGGELKATGKHPDNRLWKVFIRSVKSTQIDDAISIIDLKDQAIATSGDYHQYWVINDSAYSHIINPKTGNPLLITNQSIGSVSVLADTCLLADAIATAAMIYPSKDDAVAWLESVKAKYPTIQFWVESN